MRSSAQCTRSRWQIFCDQRSQPVTDNPIARFPAESPDPLSLLFGEKHGNPRKKGIFLCTEPPNSFEIIASHQKARKTAKKTRKPKSKERGIHVVHHRSQSQIASDQRSRPITDNSIAKIPAEKQLFFGVPSPFNRGRISFGFLIAVRSP